jgi:hypothetical protein
LTSVTFPFLAAGTTFLEVGDSLFSFLNERWQFDYAALSEMYQLKV